MMNPGDETRDTDAGAPLEHPGALLALDKYAAHGMAPAKKIFIGAVLGVILALLGAWWAGFNFNRAMALVFGWSKSAERGQLPAGTHAATAQPLTSDASPEEGQRGSELPPNEGATADKQLADSQSEAARPATSAPATSSGAAPGGARRRVALKPTDGSQPDSDTLAAETEQSSTADRAGATKSARRPTRETASTARNRPGAAEATFKAGGSASTRPPRLDRPRLTLLEQVNVPALQAGELQSINVRRGDLVTQGELLAQVNDKEQQVIARKTEAERRVAQEKYEESVDIEFAIASQKVAEAELRFHQEANRKASGTVTEIELMKDKLNVDKSRLQKEKAEVDKRVDGLTVEVKRADEDGAKLGIERRQIISPLDGQVVKIMRHAGEWVAPGDPVFRVIRMDRLGVEGELSVSTVDPRRITKGTPVAVTVPGLDGKPLTVRGTVTFVSQEIGAGGDYQVLTEIDNPRDGDHWTIYPGMPDPQVTILLDEAPLRSTAGKGSARGH